MAEAIFFRLMETSVEEKGTALQSAISNVDDASLPVHVVDPKAFRQIPRSPFAYWADVGVLKLFVRHEALQGHGRHACVTNPAGDDTRYFRAFWEVPAKLIGNEIRWVPLAKGGHFSPYYFDVHLVVDWDPQELTYRGFQGTKHRPLKRPASLDYFFRPGLNWPRRTQKGLNLRVLPAGCVFADKGPAVFVQNDDETSLLALLGVTNSSLFKLLVEMQMAFGSYEVGVLQRTPVPTDFSGLDHGLILEAHNLSREVDTFDETGHPFRLPGLAWYSDRSLLAASQDLESQAQARIVRLADIQAELDAAVFGLYGLDPAEVGINLDSNSSPDDEDEDEEEDAAAPPEDLSERVQNLLMWCVGVAFGRWDARFALNPSILPDLQGPFDPLPRCSPGALVGSDGLPADQTNIASEAWLSARENVLHIPETPLSDGEPATVSPDQYPLPIAWGGILVDDASHPADLVSRVRQVLALVWGDRAGTIEKETCEILGFKRLRDYFRDPRKGFFPFHIKRYSKSRRKAPIYWLLQSENRNYAICLYYHRMDETTYFTAARDYADTKVNLETARLDELRQGLAALSGSAQKRREREIERQQKLVTEVTNFRNKLDEIALRQLPPDHNDGVIISIAPLWELVSWKDAEKMWQELAAGNYEWSTMAQQMRQRGLVKA